MAKTELQNVREARFKVYAALGKNPSKDFLDHLNELLSEYANTEFGNDEEKAKEQRDWNREYESVRNLRPEFSMKDGKLVVTGLK